MNRQSHLIALAGLIATAPLSAPAAAQAGGPLSIETRMLAEQRVRAADGTTATRTIAPDKVVPGTPLRIVIDYRNIGAAPLGGVAITNPVPANTIYRGPAPGAPEPEVSLDGTHFAPLATLRAPGGQRTATPSDVTAVRWQLKNPLAAGAKGQFAFAAVLK